MRLVTRPACMVYILLISGFTLGSISSLVGSTAVVMITKTPSVGLKLCPVSYYHGSSSNKQVISLVAA